jgi:hypothetical protein
MYAGKTMLMEKSSFITQTHTFYKDERVEEKKTKVVRSKASHMLQENKETLL